MPEAFGGKERERLINSREEWSCPYDGRKFAYCGRAKERGGVRWGRGIIYCGVEGGDKYVR